MTNKFKTVLYVGITNNLKERLFTHKNPKGNSKAFTARYNVFYLIYFEHFFDVEQAIDREKQIKGWKRFKKDKLIETTNPKWNFLDDEI